MTAKVAKFPILPNMIQLDNDSTWRGVFGACLLMRHRWAVSAEQRFKITDLIPFQHDDERLTHEVERLSKHF